MDQWEESRDGIKVWGLTNEKRAEMELRFEG